MGYPLFTFTAGDQIEAAKNNTNFQKARDGRFELVANEAIDTTSGGPKPFYVTSNGWIALCDGNNQSKLEFSGFVLADQDVSAGEFVETMTGEGTIVGGFSGLTRGSKYYVQDDGTIGTSVGTYEVFVGYAISATELMIVKGFFEYMGNVSLTVTGDANQKVGTATVLSNARFFIVQVDAGGFGSVVLTRVGKTDGTLMGTTHGTGTVQQTANASLSGNTLTVTCNETGNDNNADMSGTVYMYK